MTLDKGLNYFTYEKAQDILRSRRRTSLILQNQTQLREEREEDALIYIVHLFDTDIIKLHPDDSVTLNADSYVCSMTTKDRFRRYLPKWLSVDYNYVRTAGKMPPIVRIETEEPFSPRRLPYQNGQRYYRKGPTPELYAMNGRDAYVTWLQVVQYAKRMAQAFMYGKFSREDVHTMHSNGDEKNIAFALDLLDTGKLCPALLSEIPTYRLTRKYMYFSEDYKMSSPTLLKSLPKEQVPEWTERKLRDDDLFRPLPGSPEHKSSREGVRKSIQEFFARWLGYYQGP